MVLSDRTIKEELAEGRIVIDPLGEGCIQPASVDVRLDRKFLVFRNTSRTHIDVMHPAEDITDEVIINDGVPFMLHPGQFALGSTLESVTIPANVVARIEGKSSLARYGLLIHSTAGFIDPGWSGRLTLEFSNVGILGVTLYFGMKIGHISFTRLTTDADRPYGEKSLGSKYRGDQGPVASKYYANYQLPMDGPGRSADSG